MLLSLIPHQACHTPTWKAGSTPPPSDLPCPDPEGRQIRTGWGAVSGLPRPEDQQAAPAHRTDWSWHCYLRVRMGDSTITLQDAQAFLRLLATPASIRVHTGTPCLSYTGK